MVRTFNLFTLGGELDKLGVSKDAIEREEIMYLLLGAQLVGVTTLLLAAVSGARRETSVAPRVCVSSSDQAKIS